MAERDPGVRRAVDFRLLRPWRGLVRQLERQAERGRRVPSPGTLLSLTLDFWTFGLWNFGILRRCSGQALVRCLDRTIMYTSLSYERTRISRVCERNARASACGAHAGGGREAGGVRRTQRTTTRRAED